MTEREATKRSARLVAMKEKSHKGQRHKGCCAMCGAYKQSGNGRDRRPARDRRQLLHGRDRERATQVTGPAP